MKEFMEFIKRGNVIDLAVAVILGVAFGAIITSLVNDLIMPLIGIIIGGIDFSALVIQAGSAQVAYGKFLMAILNFLLVALSLFLVIKAYNNLRREEPAPPPPPPATPEDVLLLREIRDLLKQQRGED